MRILIVDVAHDAKPFGSADITGMSCSSRRSGRGRRRGRGRHALPFAVVASAPRWSRRAWLVA
jgi:hypothetical protein